MKLKKSHIIPLILFSGLLFAKPVLADETVSSENTPMGHYIEQIQNQETSTDSGSGSSNPLPNIRARSFAAARVANVPSDLKSDDNTLPRKDAVDVSSYQSWMNQADFNSLKSAGVKSIIVKLTEGTNYTNPNAADQIKMAQNAGLNVAVYHYARLTGAELQSTANSLAVQEAAYFAKVAKSFGLSSKTVMIMDCEQPYRDGTGKIVGPNPITVDWATAGVQFANTLKTNGYSNTKFYTSASWIGTNTATCQMNYNTLGGPKNLWAAQYLYGKPSSSNLQNTQYGAWQYTSQMYYQGTSNLKANAVDTSIDYSEFFTDNSSAPTSTPIYRLYNSNNLEHLYTSSLNEKNTLVNIGWGKFEGISYYAPISGGIPVYRLYHKGLKLHIYTTDTNEKNVLSKSGWNYEGIVFYAATSSTGNIPVYRLYNSGIKQHLFTTDTNEKNVLSKSGWNYEGIAWYGLKS